MGARRLLMRGGGSADWELDAVSQCETTWAQSRREDLPDEYHVLQQLVE